MPGNYSSDATQVAFEQKEEVNNNHVGVLSLSGKNLWNGLEHYFLSGKFWKNIQYETPVAILADINVLKMQGLDSVAMIMSISVNGGNISVSNIVAAAGWQTISLDVPENNIEGNLSLISFEVLSISGSSGDVDLSIMVDNIRIQYDYQGSVIIIDSFGDQVTGIDNPEKGLDGFVLSQNYPNPFNPSTEISYGISVGGHVSLIIYNIIGKNVATLVDEDQSAGIYKVNFDASNLPSGTYIYRLRTKEGTRVKKMTLIK